MRVTVCQLDPTSERLDKQLGELAAHTKSADSEFLLLPEMPFSEWLAADKVPDVERWDDAVRQHDQRIAELDKLSVATVAGTRPIVNAADSRRNEAFLWSRHSRAANPVHEKYYLPDEESYWEDTWYDRGLKAFDTARAGGAVVGFQICTEMWFLEWARHFGASRVDLLCVPRATPRSSIDRWLAGGRTAAVCSGAYCLSSNQWAPEGVGADCGGVGWITDPEGNVLATTSAEVPFVTVDVDLQLSADSKSTYPRYVTE